MGRLTKLVGGDEPFADDRRWHTGYPDCRSEPACRSARGFLFLQPPHRLQPCTPRGHNHGPAATRPPARPAGVSYHEVPRCDRPVSPWQPLTLVALVATPSQADVKTLLGSRILSPGTPQREVISFTESRVPPMPVITSKAQWEAHARVLRQRVLDEIVFRGEAAKWRTATSSVQWMETISGGPGYRIRKVRYEALPGLWIPALLYEPEGLTKNSGRIPVVLNVNGHDRPNGKAAKYKQIRCINQARRGMLALNVEWLGMGQLHKPEYGHYLMNQLDLCGTSGLAPFYLSMSRGIDLLLEHPNADPQRVAVAGLSGGGWQTITISALDTRVTLSDPVAGYSSLLTRTRNFSDLGDSGTNSLRPRHRRRLLAPDRDAGSPPDPADLQCHRQLLLRGRSRPAAIAGRGTPDLRPLRQTQQPLGPHQLLTGKPQLRP